MAADRSLYRAGYVVAGDRSLCRAGSLTTAGRKLSRYKLDLVGVREFRWDERGHCKIRGL